MVLGPIYLGHICDLVLLDCWYTLSFPSCPKYTTPTLHLIDPKGVCKLLAINKVYKLILFDIFSVLLKLLTF